MPEEILERERAIETALLAVERMSTDYQKCGKEKVGVDLELKRGVAVFLAMGMETDSSCWGHPERRDDENALSAEKNLLPYIDFSGYKPTDGINDDGEQIGYSEEEVDSASRRMKKDAITLEELLDRFYKLHNEKERLIELNYWKDAELPIAKLQTAHAEQIDNMSRDEQDSLIAEARKQWGDFLRFVEKNMLVQPS
jgi:hypothetical protein